MKKLILILFVTILITGCATSTKQQTIDAESDETVEIEQKEDSIKSNNFPTSEQLLQALKKRNANLMDIEVFDENTDPNKKLGRPGSYITKADFSDSRVEQLGEHLCGGTIETFSNKKDCEKRTKYLEDLNEKGTGVLGVNQYIYSYDRVLFRVDYDLTPEQAEEYNKQMMEIMEQYIKTGSLEIEDNNNFSNSEEDAFVTFKNSIMDSAKDFEITDENSNSYFEIVIKSSAEVSKLEASEIAENQLFNAFALSAGYLCNNFESNTDYGKAGHMAFDLIKSIVLDDESSRKDIVDKIKALGSVYSMEVQTLPEISIDESESDDLESIELSTGKYIVGEDIPAGKYDIEGIKSGNVRVCSQGKDYGDIVSEIITPGETTYANVVLKDGYTLEVILGGKIQLQPK